MTEFPILIHTITVVMIIQITDLMMYKMLRQFGSMYISGLYRSTAYTYCK